MKTVIVQKKLWHTGSDNFLSALRSSGSRRMCCLGFAAREAGCKGITDVSYPHELPTVEFNKFRKMFPKLNIDACYELVEINDSDLLTREEKAEKIHATGKKFGVNFVFI